MFTSEIKIKPFSVRLLGADPNELSPFDPTAAHDRIDGQEQLKRGAHTVVEPEEWAEMTVSGTVKARVGFDTVSRYVKDDARRTVVLNSGGFVVETAAAMLRDANDRRELQQLVLGGQLVERIITRVVPLGDRILLGTPRFDAAQIVEAIDKECGNATPNVKQFMALVLGFVMSKYGAVRSPWTHTGIVDFGYGDADPKLAHVWMLGKLEGAVSAFKTELEDILKKIPESGYAYNVYYRDIDYCFKQFAYRLAAAESDVNAADQIFTLVRNFHNDQFWLKNTEYTNLRGHPTIALFVRDLTLFREAIKREDTDITLTRQALSDALDEAGTMFRASPAVVMQSLRDASEKIVVRKVLSADGRFVLGVEILPRLKKFTGSSTLNVFGGETAPYVMARPARSLTNMHASVMSVLNSMATAVDSSHSAGIQAAARLLDLGGPVGTVGLTYYVSKYVSHEMLLEAILGKLDLVLLQLEDGKQIIASEVDIAALQHVLPRAWGAGSFFDISERLALLLPVNEAEPKSVKVYEADANLLKGVTMTKALITHTRGVRATEYTITTEEGTVVVNMDPKTLYGEVVGGDVRYIYHRDFSKQVDTWVEIMSRFKHSLELEVNNEEYGNAADNQAHAARFDFLQSLVAVLDDKYITDMGVVLYRKVRRKSGLVTLSPMTDLITAAYCRLAVLHGLLTSLAPRSAEKLTDIVSWMSEDSAAQRMFVERVGSPMISSPNLDAGSVEMLV